VYLDISVNEGLLYTKSPNMSDLHCIHSEHTVMSYSGLDYHPLHLL
jgi:hypothetical protein